MVAKLTGHIWSFAELFETVTLAKVEAQTDGRMPRWEIGEASYVRAEMTLSIEGDCQVILARLFQTDEAGHLRFGWSATSLDPAKHWDLMVTPILFRDYIMEGFVEYKVSVTDLMPGCMLSVLGSGSNRDQYILPQVSHFIAAAGLSIASETSN